MKPTEPPTEPPATLPPAEEPKKEPSKEPSGDAVRVFWQVARERVGLASLEAIIGQRVDSSLRPPVVVLSDSKPVATRLAEKFRDGHETQFCTPTADYVELEVERPQVGDLMIICNGEGIPLTLVRTTNVQEEPEGTLVETVTPVYPPLPKQKKNRGSV